MFTSVNVVILIVLIVTLTARAYGSGTSERKHCHVGRMTDGCFVGSQRGRGFNPSRRLTANAAHPQGRFVDGFGGIDTIVGDLQSSQLEGRRQIIFPLDNKESSEMYG